MFDKFDYFNRGYIFGVKTDKYNPYINYTWSMLPNGQVKNIGTSGTNLQLYSGNPLDFQGSQYIDTDVSSSALDISQDFNITVAFKEEVANKVVFSDVTNSNLALYTYLSASYPMRFAFGGSYYNFTNSLPLEYKTVTIEKLGTTLNFYVDGVLDSTREVTQTPTLTSNVRIGASSNVYFDGQLDYLTISNRVLTQEEIELSNSNPNAFYDSMVNDANTLFATDFRGTAKYIADDKNKSIGSELVVNGTFDTDLSGWGTGNTWSFNNGTALSNGGGSWLQLNSSPFASNSLVMISYEIKNYTSGSIRPATSSQYGTYKSGNGIYCEILPSVTNGWFAFTPSSFIGAIDNISVKEISAVYPITNYSATMRTNFQTETTGLQDLTRSFDSLGFYTGVTDYLNGNGKGYGDTGWKINSASQIGVPFTLEVVDKISGDIAYEGDGRYNYFGFQNSQFKLFGNTCALYSNKDFNYRVAVYDGSSIVLYVNGVAGTPAPITSLLTSEDTYKIGLMLDRPDRNRINPLRLWIAHQKVLTQAEITYNFNKYQELGLLQ